MYINIEQIRLMAQEANILQRCQAGVSYVNEGLAKDFRKFGISSREIAAIKFPDLTRKQSAMIKTFLVAYTMPVAHEYVDMRAPDIFLEESDRYA